MIGGKSANKAGGGRMWLWIVLAAAFLGLAYQVINSFRNPSITVEWVTSGEEATSGYNLYKAEGPDAPYQKINGDMIPGAPDPERGADYRFVDREVTAGTTYYYQVEEVKEGGETVRHRPIIVTARTGGWLQLLALTALALAVLLILSPGPLRIRSRGNNSEGGPAD